MRLLHLEYRVRFCQAMRVGAGLGFARIVDDSIVRTAGPGPGPWLPYIPGSSIKGRVRSHCQQLGYALSRSMDQAGRKSKLMPCDAVRVCKNDPCVQCRLFGSPFTPGSLRFSDARLSQEMQALLGLSDSSQPSAQDPFVYSQARTGIKLERATRTVEPDFLFSLEHADPDLVFEGSITGLINLRPPLPGTEQGLPAELWLLVVGLRMVDKLGGMKSRGLGRCRIEITRLVTDGCNDLTTRLDELLGEGDSLLGVDYYDEPRIESIPSRAAAPVG